MDVWDCTGQDNIAIWLLTCLTLQEKERLYSTGDSEINRAATHTQAQRAHVRGGKEIYSSVSASQASTAWDFRGEVIAQGLRNNATTHGHKGWAATSMDLAREITTHIGTEDRALRQWIVLES